MYLKRHPQHGFTVIELLITIAIVAILSSLGIPTMTGAINNAKVRSAAEALQNGLRTAQTEAIRRSRQTAFVLTDATPALNAQPAINGKYWYIQTLPMFSSEGVAEPYVQGGQFGAATAGVTITGPAVMCFNSIGRVVANAATGLPGSNDCIAPSATTFDVSRVGADRTLQLQVSAAGKIRMCDRSRTIATQPDGC